MQRTGIVAGLLALLSALPVAAQSRTHAVIITGIGGEPRFQAVFHEWGATMVKAATERWGVPAEDVVFLTEQPERAPDLADGRSTKEEIAKTLAAIGRTAGPDDVVFILFIGHGSFSNNEARLSLPGPDVTAQELAVMIDGLGQSRVVVVNAASSSGAFLEPLSGANRIVITSTRSGMEQSLEVRRLVRCCVRAGRCRHGQGWRRVDGGGVRVRAGRDASRVRGGADIADRACRPR
jgi:hypothetical protein